jgi:hypothetical protein
MQVGQFSIGGHPQASGAQLGSWRNGRIYQLAVYNRRVSDAEVKCIEEWMMKFHEILPVYDGLVGWWDFTRRDPGNMYISRTGTGTAVVTNGDEIGWIKNLAPGQGAGYDKLGSFLRAHDDTSAYRPVFQGVGGINDKTYATFDDGAGTNPARGLRGGYFTTANCNDDGGETTTKFSDLVLNMAAQTIFIICRAEIDNFAADGYTFFMEGNAAGGGTTKLTSTGTKVASDDKYHWLYIDTPSGSNAEAITTSTMNNDARCVMLHSKASSGGMTITFDGSLAGQTTPVSDTCSFAKTSNNTDGAPRFALGCSSAADTGVTAGSWGGDIYEVLYYAKTLSPTEIACVETYINNKYGLNFS